MKRCTIILTIIICILTVNISVYATSETNTQNNSIEKMNMYEYYDTINSLIQGIVNKDTSFLINNVTLFTSNSYDRMYKYIESNDIVGEVGDVTIDFIHPASSSTGDTVVMANFKVWEDNKKYNTIYLLELHIDRNGDIYGYNMWLY